jgi:hypothetical protein
MMVSTPVNTLYWFSMANGPPEMAQLPSAMT